MNFVAFPVSNKLEARRFTSDGHVDQDSTEKLLQFSCSNILDL